VRERQKGGTWSTNAASSSWRETAAARWAVANASDAAWLSARPR
jgi:hypothetical protein